MYKLDKVFSFSYHLVFNRRLRTDAALQRIKFQLKLDVFCFPILYIYIYKIDDMLLKVCLLLCLVGCVLSGTIPDQVRKYLAGGSDKQFILIFNFNNLHNQLRKTDKFAKNLPFKF